MKPRRFVKNKNTENDENEYESDESLPVMSQRRNKRKYQNTQNAENEASTSQLLSQNSNEMTDYEKEVMVDTVTRRIYSKYFGTQKTFRKASIFLPTDKVSSKNQLMLMPMIIEKIKEKTRLDLISDGDRYMFTVPNELRNCNSQVENSNEDDEIFRVVLMLVLGLIYSHKGLIAGELLKEKIPQLIPDLNLSNTSYKDLNKILNEFEQRGYINKVVNPPVGDKQPTATIHWGHRANLEVNKKDLLPLFCMFFSVDLPIELPIWLRESVEANTQF